MHDIPHDCCWSIVWSWATLKPNKLPKTKSSDNLLELTYPSLNAHCEWMTTLFNEHGEKQNLSLI